MKVSLNKGVRITPEIDMPAHALAFTKVFPEYAVMGEVSPLMKKRPLTDHINVADPKAMEFVKSIFDEYTKGDEPVFPKGSTVHIGADEFLTDYGAYRKFLNEIIPYLKKTNPVRLWGSLSWIKDSPETPIVKEAIDGVQVNLWSEAWADGKEMYDMGFDLINTDHKFYVVPNGTKIRAPYMDYIIKRNAIKKFEPNRVFRKNSKSIINCLPAISRCSEAALQSGRIILINAAKAFKSRIYMTAMQTALLLLQKKHGAHAQISTLQKLWTQQQMQLITA